MLKGLNESLSGPAKAYTLKLPVTFHNLLKAEASLHGQTKNELLLSLLVEGAKHYNSTK